MRYDPDEIAQLLSLCVATRNKRDLLALDRRVQGDRCRELNRPGILSVSAISSLVGCSSRAVRYAIRGMHQPEARGRLNPDHIEYLAHLLSSRDTQSHWLPIMVKEGTSVSTISDLTGISEATIYRRL